jgi:type I restriction enzyme M protein
MVDVADIQKNKYDLSISRYKAVEHNVVVYEEPEVVLGKLIGLENEISIIMKQIKKKISEPLTSK